MGKPLIVLGHEPQLRSEINSRTVQSCIPFSLKKKIKKRAEDNYLSSGYWGSGTTSCYIVVYFY